MLDMNSGRSGNNPTLVAVVRAGVQSDGAGPAGLRSDGTGPARAHVASRSERWP